MDKPNDVWTRKRETPNEDKHDPKDGLLVPLLWIAVMLAVLNFTTPREECHAPVAHAVSRQAV